MYKILDEIKDLLEAATYDPDKVLDGKVVSASGATVTSFDDQPDSFSRIVLKAVSGSANVAAGTLSITGTDLNGEVITEEIYLDENDSRELITANEFVTVTQIVFPAQDGEVTWDVGIKRFNKYYTGKIGINRIGVNDCPVLMVYGLDTNLLSDQLSTCRDKYAHTIRIELITNAFLRADEDELKSSTELLAQKALWQFMEERDSSYKPLPTTILGVLRGNITGTNYLFNNDITIEYEEENIDGKVFFRAILTMSLTTRYNNR